MAERAYGWTRLIEDAEGETVLVAADGSRVIRFGAVTTGGDAELTAMYVTPEHYGLGAGTALHSALIRLRPSVPAWRLKVVEKNSRALSFYRRHGWRRTAAHQREWWDGQALEIAEMRLIPRHH